jgi:transcriptional regulator with XRE-family HTH domain
MYKPKEAKLFGAALKRLLHEQELSDRQFAKQAGLEHSYVSKLLNPKPGKEIAEPRKKTRQQLAQGLGITEQELLEQIARYSNSEVGKTISALPGLAESEEAIAQPHRELREAVDTSASDLRLRYFEEVQEIVYAGDGEISLVDRITLDALRKDLGLIAEDTAAIEDEILQPFQKYKKKLQQYEQELVEIIQHEYPLSNETKYYLERLQHSLKLRKKDVVQITAQILGFNELDFTKLRDLLAGGKWKDADQETFALMLNAVGREEGDRLRVEDIEKFPYPYLHTIDQLWITASNGRFGFSIQKGIWHNLGGTPDANGEIYRCFGERVGWRVEGGWLMDDELTYSINAPVGHLPVFLWCGLFGEMDEDVSGDAGCRRLVGYSVTLDGVEVSRLFSRV